MPLRRRIASTLKKLSRAVGTVCEPLESRQLLTAAVNGVFTGTNTQYDGQTFFEYRQANGNAVIRISLFGNITAEFVGASNTSGLIQPAELIGATPNNTSNVFLFQIYVVKADMNSVISIAQTAAPGQVNRPMTPFGGGLAMRVVNAQTGLTQVITPTDGTAFIGALTPNNLAAPANNIPVTSMFLSTPFGMRPAGTVYSGLEVAKGNNLGKFFLGGTITGRVNVQGSMDTFYAGNIFTGDASGLTSQFATGTPAANFYIQGDIHNIVCADSIGTNVQNGVPAINFTSITYKTGFQLKVGGRVGQVFANNSFLGQALVIDDPKLVTPATIQHEIEVRGADLTPPAGSTPVALDPTFFDPFFQGYDIGIGGTTADARFNNDTFATAQFLGSFNSSNLGSKTGIDLQGALRTQGVVNTGGVVGDSDNADYYAVSLLAGQSMDIQLADDLQGINTRQHPRLGVFDPDGRLIATNYSKIDDAARLGNAIRITADRPGPYRIAIADFGDINFNGTTDAGEPGLSSPRPTLRYELKIRNVGDLAVGGLVANLHIATLDGDPNTGILSRGIEVVNGDLGGVRAGVGAAGATVGYIYSTSLAWKVSNGNFRSMEANTMGLAAPGGTFSGADSGPDFLVPKGTVGLLRTTGATTAMFINDSRDVPADSAGRFFPSSTGDLSRTSSLLAVGKDIQLVDCAGTLEGDLLANRAIGVIRAARIGGFTSPNAGVGGFTSPPVIQANVDKVGNDGVIDLIDVSGNGTFTGDLNSAAIMTGPGGNVRYIRVVGAAFRDFFFGGASTIEQTVYGPGAQASITDDSGARVVLTPLPHDPVSQFPPAPSSSGFQDPPFLTVLTYPIRGTGGRVILRVGVTTVDDTTDGIARLGGGGLQVDSSSNGGGSVEIGEVQLGVPVVAGAGLTGTVATGNPFTFNAFTGTNAGIAPRSFAPNPPPVAPAQPTRDLNLVFQGPATVDVWNINAPATVATINTIRNSTPGGEIVNLLSVNPNVDVFSLSADSVGIAKTHTAAAVNGQGFGAAVPVLDNTFPFVQQRNLIRVGDLGSVSARRSIGNILSTSNIGAIVANSDRTDVKGVFEGIAAPIVMRGAGNGITGNIVSVNIGEGILPSGSGDVGLAGVYATSGVIDSISGTNGDIRGDIVAGGPTLARVTQQATDAAGNPLVNPNGTALIVSTPTPIIGSVHLVNGSIIDADIMTSLVAESRESINTFTTIEVPGTESFNQPAFDIGGISLDGKGGIIGAYIVAQDIGGIQVNGGFGMINSQVIADGGSVLQSVGVDGYGVRDTVLSSQSTRSISARGNGALATTTGYSASVRQSETNTFDAFSGKALDGYNDLHKYLGTTATRARLAGVSETGVIQDSQFLGAGDLGSITANKIVAKNTMRVVDPASGKVQRIPYGDSQYPMRIAFASSIGSITVKNSINGLALGAGRLSNLAVGREIGSSEIDVAGPIGKIVAGTLRSSSLINVTGSEGRINYLGTKGTLFSSVNVTLDIGTVNVGTEVGSKRINTGRNIGNFTVNGSILTGAHVTVGKTLSKLFVGQDVKLGSSVQADAILQQTVKGQIAGDIIIV